MTNELTLEQLLNQCDPRIAHDDEEIIPKTLGEALNATAIFKSNKFDLRAEPSLMCFDGDGHVITLDDGDLFGRPFDRAYANRAAVTHLLSLVAQGTGLNATYIYQNAPGWLAADNLNYWNSQRGGELTYRFYGGGAGDTLLRAVGGPRFSVNLDNEPVLDALMDIERKDGEPLFTRNFPVARSYVKRDAMRVQIKLPREVQIADLPNGRASTYGVGLAITNGEIRNRSLAVTPIVWRTRCDNSIFVPEWRSVSYRHVGGASAAVAMMEMVGVLGDILSPDSEWSFDKLMARVEDAARAELTMSKALDVVSAFVDAFSLGESGEQQLVDTFSHYSSTRLGISNAVTEFAQTLPDRTKQEQLEVAAGNFMFGLPVRAVEFAELD